MWWMNKAFHNCSFLISENHLNVFVTSIMSEIQSTTFTDRIPTSTSFSVSGGALEWNLRSVREWCRSTYTVKLGCKKISWKQMLVYYTPAGKTSVKFKFSQHHIWNVWHRVRLFLRLFLAGCLWRGRKTWRNVVTSCQKHRLVSFQSCLWVLSLSTYNQCVDSFERADFVRFWLEHQNPTILLSCIYFSHKRTNMHEQSCPLLLEDGNSISFTAASRP